MKKKILLIATLFSGLTFGQDDGHGHDHVHDYGCGTDFYMQKVFEENPSLETEMHETDERISSGAILPMDRDANYYIPVVFHILHDGDNGNISDEQIQSAIDQLNEDYNTTNSDLSSTRNTADAPFLPNAGDYHLFFGLAKKDPDGNCTNGIQRRDIGDASYNAGNEIKDGSVGLDNWPRSEYLNIWVVNSINNDGGTGIILGYAQFPGWGSAGTYGIVIRHDRTGTMGTASSGDRTLTHEVGHCLNLYHTFQGSSGMDGCVSGNCSSEGDRVCDTPPQQEAFWSCSSSQNSCSYVPPGDEYGFDTKDQFENFMSYSPCQYMFTEGQRDRTYATFSAYTWMSNLVSLANANDKEILTAGPLCEAEFSSTETTVCTGSTVTFADESYHNVTSRTWTFPGGTPGTSSAENPVVTYSTPGVYDVTLEVSDGSSTETKSITNHIVVFDNTGESLPYHQGFESLTSLPDYDNMLVENNDGGQAFDIYTGAGSSGLKSARLANFGVDNGTSDAIISPTIDLSSLTADDDLAFTFDIAYKRRSSGNDEVLKVYVSKDCGETWALRKNVDDDDLGETVQSTSYTPEGQGDWRTITITNVTESYFVSNFRFKLEFTNDNGNNIFIDNINLYNAAFAGIEDDKQNLAEWSVYPNPVANDFAVTINSVGNAEYNVSLFNLLGEQIDVIHTGVLSNGANTLNYSMAELPKGVYVVRVESNGVVESKKIIKQ